MVENLTIDRLRQDASRRRCVNGYQRSANSLRRRASALPHSRGLCAPAGAAPSPFLDGRKSDHRPLAPTCVQASVRAWIPKVGKLPLAAAPSHRVGCHLSAGPGRHIPG
jgi:hypothetical protein